MSRKRRPARGGLLVAAALGCVLTGCSAAQRHRVLSTLCDGVPPLHAPAAVPEFRPVGDPAGQPADPAPVEFQHEPFAEGACPDCHEPGAGNHVVAAPELCWECHDADLAEGATVHFPVQEGLCLDCHNPHQGVASPLLRRSGAALCAICHDREAVAGVPAHRLAPPGEACAVCHAGHDTGAVAMLKLDPTGNPCFRCHPAEGNLAPERRRHGPAAAGRCLTCHGSHAAGGPAHLVTGEADLCGRCHEPTAAAVPHDPVADGDCLACHDPHGAAAGPMLRTPVPELCWECHDAAIVEGRVRHAPAGDEGCLQCHAIHGGPQPALLFEAAPALCRSCHPGAIHRSRELAGLDDCLACHDPHSAPGSRLLR